MTKITIASLDSINNVGDELLGLSTAWLVRKSGNEHLDIDKVQLMPTYTQLFYNGYYLSCFAIPFNYLAKQFNPKRRVSFFLWKTCYFLKYKSYYRKWIANTDKVILPVGMLKYANQNFSFIFELINSLATQYGKFVLMNAMSVAKPDQNDPRYKQLVKSVNLPSVWGVTTRDGIDGLSFLGRDYIRKKMVTDFVGDPALWIPEIFGKSNNQKESNNIIGVNLIRKNIFSSYYGESFSSIQMKELYKQIVEELEKRGYQWVFFCNGMTSDYNFGLELIDEMGLPCEKMLPKPSSAGEYVETISKFKAVFGARLHACITSVALGVPVVGMLWDDKLKYFSRTMGIDQFFLKSSLLNGENVVNAIEKSLGFQFDYNNRDFYKQKTFDCIEKFVKN